MQKGFEVTEANDLSAARDEVTSLDALEADVIAKIADLKSSQKKAPENSIEDELQRARRNLLVGYEELANCSYGRTVLGRVTDIDGKLKGPFFFASHRPTSAISTMAAA